MEVDQMGEHQELVAAVAVDFVDSEGDLVVFVAAAEVGTEA